MSTDTRSSASGSSGRADLSRRIALTLAFVLAADAAFAAVLASLARPWLAPLVGDPSGIGLFGWLAVVGATTAVLAWAQLRYVRREALSAADARPVSEAEYPDLHARVERLARTADVPAPDLAVADSEVPNSFALAGVGGATVVVSTGLVDALADDELDAVVAHELAHLKNRDAAVTTLATFLPALANDDYAAFEDFGGPVGRALGLVALGVAGYAASTALVAAPAFSPASLVAFAGFAGFTVLFGGAALGVLAIPAVVLVGRLSRLREFAADRAGALLAGDPAAMASALETLDDEAPARPTEDARATGVRELCFLPHGIVAADANDGEDGADAGGTSEDRAGEGPASESERDGPLAGLPLDVATHPPTDERVARLRDLAAAGTEAYE